jgi:hypothetical protein
LGRPFEDRAELAMQGGGDLAALGAGREGDALDQATDSFRCLVALLRTPERLGEAFHLAAVDAGDVRVKVWDVHRRAGETGGQFVLPGFQVAKVGHEGTAIATVLDGGDDFFELLLDVGERLAVGAPEERRSRLRRLVSSAKARMASAATSGAMSRSRRPSSMRDSSATRAMLRLLVQLPFMT